jgi:hypothetical protein
LGYEQCQFLVVDHHRDDPGHDWVHDHDHIHIVTNAVTLEGDYVRDSFDRYRIQHILRDAERDFGLSAVKSSWEVKREKAIDVELDSEIAKIVVTALEHSPSLDIWLDRLSKSGVSARFNLSKNDNVMGITYLKDGEIYKGSDIGASWGAIAQKLNVSSTDIELMKATNLKTQAMPANLSRSDRALFDRAVEMAVMKSNGSSKFKNNRVEIERERDTLRVLRMRPHKLMLAAERIDGVWHPVGFPNLDRRDVELLERANGIGKKRSSAESELGDRKYRVIHTPETETELERSHRRRTL